jgi:hypothetical protein
MKRRQFLNRTGTLLAASWAFPAVVRADLKAAQVLVVGGGYGGATAAKYLRLLSDYRANVTLIEPELSFVSCPLSNLVLGGSSTLSELTVSYETLQKQHGVTLVRDWVTGIDPLKKVVQLKSGQTLGYDKLVLAPGIGLMMDSIEGLVQANQVGATLQAWKAGPETLALQQQLQQMHQQQAQQEQQAQQQSLSFLANEYIPKKHLTDEEKYQIVKDIWDRHDKVNVPVQEKVDVPVLVNLPQNLSINVPINITQKNNFTYHKKRYNEKKLNWENLRK